MLFLCLLVFTSISWSPCDPFRLCVNIFRVIVRAMCGTLVTPDDHRESLFISKVSCKFTRSLPLSCPSSTSETATFTLFNITITTLFYFQLCFTFVLYLFTRVLVLVFTDSDTDWRDKFRVGFALCGDFGDLPVTDVMPF